MSGNALISENPGRVMNIRKFESVRRIAYRELDIPDGQRQSAIQLIREELESECVTAPRLLAEAQLVGRRYEEHENLEPSEPGVLPYVEIKVEHWYRIENHDRSFAQKTGATKRDELLDATKDNYQAEIEDVDRYR